MHVIFFGLKRAYHASLRVFRRALTRLGLTAARFDLLYIVLKEKSLMFQHDLRRHLGVAAPTVSRMLASLEGLGLVERQVAHEDRRWRYVRLTKAGRRCVRKAARLLILAGHAQLAVDSALCPNRWTNKARCEEVSDDLDWALRRLRRGYRDRSTQDYPWTYAEAFDDLKLPWSPEIVVGL